MKRILTICAAVLVLCSTANAVTWNVPEDFLTIEAALASPDVLDGHTILVGPGNHSGAYVSKAVEIKGEGGAVINDGPMHPAGLTMGFRLLAGSDGATISHLGFTVDLAIMNGAAVSDVTVDHCTFTNTIQAVSNWRGNGWQISHNVINDLRTSNGGGIGILIADYMGGTVSDNVVSHNKITGTLHVHPEDGGGYNGSGIVIYADFRWGGAGATDISNNRIVKNKVGMVLDDPRIQPIPDENKIDIVAFELTQAYYPANPPSYPDPLPEDKVVIKNNAIGFNDWRGTVLQLDITLGLEGYNQISRNMGDNRGHGLHPSVFGPGGN